MIDFRIPISYELWIFTILLFVLQTQWMKSYQEEVDRLAAEVDNIQDIRDALPNDCFKQLALEPEP